MNSMISLQRKRNGISFISVLCETILLYIGPKDQSIRFLSIPMKNDAPFHFTWVMRHPFPKSENLWGKDTS